MNGTQQESQMLPVMPIDWEEKQKEPRLNFKSQWKCFLKWKGYTFNGMLRGYYTQRGRKCMLNRLCIDDTTKGHWNRKNSDFVGEPCKCLCWVESSASAPDQSPNHPILLVLKCNLPYHFPDGLVSTRLPSCLALIPILDAGRKAGRAKFSSLLRKSNDTKHRMTNCGGKPAQPAQISQEVGIKPQDLVSVPATIQCHVAAIVRLD